MRHILAIRTRLIVSFLILVYLSPSGIGEQVDARDKPVGALHISVDTRLGRRHDEVRTIDGLVVVADDDIVVIAAQIVRQGSQIVIREIFIIGPLVSG